MQTRLIKLRWRRRFRKSQHQVEDIGTQAEQQIEQYLLKRFDRLVPVRRFVISWLGLVLLLIAAVVAQNLGLSTYYQTLQAVPGGTYNEGLRGRFTNASPLFATSDADATVSRLVFAGLLKSDNQGKLIGDLAHDITSDSRGTLYTVHLKPKLTWQDGQPLTSKDVVFTYQAIQNPDTKSPLQPAWQGISISAPDSHTVVFKLPSTLSSFPNNLLTGIVPEHLLRTIPPTDLRSADFNTVHPIGAGPFAWRAVQVSGNGDPTNAQEQVELTPFRGYIGGTPKLQKFVVQVFANQDQLINAFRSNQLTAIEGSTELPKDLQQKSSVQTHSLTLRAATMIFFKTSSGVLGDQQVRQALIQAANVPELITSLGWPAREVREPLLLGQLGYDPSLAQAAFSSSAANKILDSDGWLLAKNGIRIKNKQPLSFSLSTADTPDNRHVTARLQQQWWHVGVRLNIQLLGTNDFQNAVAYHSYDALLDGISIGVDPDIFVYWHSSQADIRSTNRLNLSEFKNSVADAALEAGRTRLDPTLRIIKYKPFLEQWQQAAPALGLYQPRLVYLTNVHVSGFRDQGLTVPTDRFNNVQNWEIRQAKITN